MIACYCCRRRRHGVAIKQEGEWTRKGCVRWTRLIIRCLSTKLATNARGFNRWWGRVSETTRYAGRFVLEYTLAHTASVSVSCPPHRISNPQIFPQNTFCGIMRKDLLAHWRSFSYQNRSGYYRMENVEVNFSKQQFKWKIQNLTYKTTKQQHFLPSSFI